MISLRVQPEREAVRRRGTVLIMVLAVLAMLFIVGSSLLVMARSERDRAQTGQIGRTVREGLPATTEPVIAQLAEDFKSSDGVPYKQAWAGELVAYGDFAGLAFNAAGLQAEQIRIRHGNLLLSSAGPYLRDDGAFRQFAFSWPLSAILAGSTHTPPDNNQGFGLAGGDTVRDPSGDGLRDGAESLLLSQMGDLFGTGYRLGLRVLPHGGMVMLDPSTPPSLLSQVIHPQDDPFHENPLSSSLWASVSIDVRHDENSLRRRFFLPRERPSSELEAMLPVTMGFEAPSGAGQALQNATPHWWRYGAGTVAAEEATWEDRLRPGGPNRLALTHTGYQQTGANDFYDRRHLITRANYDDILRRQRDEQRLFTHFDNVLGTQFLSVIQPPESGAVDDAYGLDDGGATVFNVPGLRTQFSLRDVLDPNTGRGSYRRAMQLTAYYLAMIQHTTAPGASRSDPTGPELLQQLRTAMQLAVNTIDFADNDGGDHVPSYFAYPPPPASPSIEVWGVEKQPYITEAYAKVVILTDGDPMTPVWDPATVDSESVFAVELYNPYDVPLPLTDYELLEVTADGSPLDLAGKQVPEQGYLVIANRLNDPNDSTGGMLTPFVPGAVLGTDFVVDPLLEIEEHATIRLRRKENTSFNLSDPGGLTPMVVVDEIRPLGNQPGETQLGAPPDSWAKRALTVTDLPPGRDTPNDASDKLVRDSSLQRHKEAADQPPVHWHFTLSRQMLFPHPALDADFPRTWDDTEPPSHNLLGSRANYESYVHVDNPPNMVEIVNQDIVASEFRRRPLGYPDPMVGNAQPIWVVDAALANDAPIAPFPVVTSDFGVHADTGGTLAFPTTGTLLLVTRYAHTPDGPVSVAATKGPYVPDRQAAPIDLDQMVKVDNGHLPVFDTDQRCTDLDQLQGRLNVPWGQLVFDYFTALPLEELVRPLPALGGTRLIDQSDVDYENHYTDYFAGYPVVLPVAASGGRTIGPRVRGRININFGPWWVLDGLPMLPDMLPDTTNTVWPFDNGLLTGLPVPEIYSSRLEHPELLPLTERFDLPVATNRPIMRFLDVIVDDINQDDTNYYDGTRRNPVGNNLANVGPDLARYMEGYREMRQATGDTNLTLASVPDVPGFVTVGAMADLLARVRVRAIDPDPDPANADVTSTLHSLRQHAYQTDPTNPMTWERPFSYMGYLQLVTPLVRLQDWATVKNHVFTVYSTVSKDGIQLRSQVTVDRTRCLYTNDLPLRIAETEPVNYANAADD